MDINKIGSIGKIGKINSGGVIKDTGRGAFKGNDILSISTEAKKAHDLDCLKSFTFNLISSFSDVRSDKIEIAARRIKEGYYNKHTADIAESLLNSSV